MRWLAFPVFLLPGLLLAEDSSVAVAGNDQVAEIIANYEGRGTLADGSTPTAPEEALKGFRLREGFEIELVASEPVIGQPLHLSWDSKGRMWVTQYLQYQFPAGLRIIEYDNHLRALFDKVPEPPPHGPKGADKITVFEDTTGDGVYDSHRDVITGLNIATSVETGAGGIWVTNPPYLLFYPDEDGDANPDTDPEVILSGFGLEDTHAVANSLKWGPDGWLYGVTGSTTTSKVRCPATGEMLSWEGQAVWRYHPTSTHFELYAEGGGNTFSLEIDSTGRVFSGTNNGKTRGMYYPLGSYGKKSWGKHGPLTNPYAFGYFQHMAHEGDDRRFAQAFCIYEGGLFPESWNRKVITANSLHNVVWVSELLPDGSTFRTVDEEPLLETDDRWFRPVFCGVGPDGCVYLADWYDSRLSHVRPVDDWHKSSGRIYRIKPVGTEPKATRGDLSRIDEKDLSEFKEEENWVVKKRAILELNWRSLEDRSDIYPIGLRYLAPILKSAKENPRAGETLSLPNEALELSGVEGRALFVSGLRDVSARNAIPLLGRVLVFDEDFDDPHIPLLLWWAFEEHAESGRKEIEALAAAEEIWDSRLFREFIAERLSRRYAMAGGEENYLSAARLLSSAPDAEAKERLMTGIQLAFQGVAAPALPEALQAELDAYAESAGANSLVMKVRQGDAGALKEAIKLVASNESDPVNRLELAQVLGEVEDPSVVPVLLKTLALDQESALKRVALLSLSNYDSDAIPKTVLARHGSTLPAEHEVRSTAHRVLASRPDWAKQFLEKVEVAHIKARNVAPDVVQLLARHDDPEIDAAIQRLWPSLANVSSEVYQSESNRLRGILGAESGDPDMGKVHYQARCASCHVLFGEGNSIGPDLTGYERHNLEFWLPAILDPNLELREGYLNYVATLKDGQILSGFLQEQTPQTVTLRDMAGQHRVLNRDRLASLSASKVSLMPLGLLNGMSDGELRDLFAYLMK